eukprot:g21229.t1
MGKAKARWDEDSEEFEEDISPKEFCTEKARICEADAKGLSHMLDEASRKEKHLKEEPRSVVESTTSRAASELAARNGAPPVRRWHGLHLKLFQWPRHQPG